MKELSTFNKCITADDFGGKAFWINRLYQGGIRVPQSLFIPVMSRDEIMHLQKHEVFQKKLWHSLGETFRGVKKLAIRSSGLGEDGERESKAGHYRTFLNVDNCMQKIFSCFIQMASDIMEDDSIGIIIQEMVSPDISGVVFSSNPWNGKKSEVYVSMTSGLGDKLLSGMYTGEDIKLTIQDGIFHIPKYTTDLDEENLFQIAEIAKKIEKIFMMPVDIEWCIEKGSNQLVILQCRPITSIFLDHSEIIPLNMQSLILPKYLIDNDKIKLRYLAEQNQIMISNAYLAVYNCREDDVPDVKISVDKSPYYKGFSVVLLSPSDIDGKVQRFFVGEDTQICNSLKRNRFGVRVAASYSNVENCIKDMYHIAKEKQWTCSIIIQEILDAKYTGIIKKNEKGYVIEIARGHFLSKGIFPMSIYVTDFEGSLLYKHEVRQRRYIDFEEGSTLEYYDQAGAYVTFPAEYIKKIATYFSDIILQEHMIVEFGILNDEERTPYLLDCVRETSPTDISCKAIEKGILSEGKIKGKLVKVDLNDFNSAFNMHYHDNREISKVSEEYIIFYAHSPSIQLLNLLKQYEMPHIGFAFQTGSLLCHMSVLLREYHIPAIRGVDESTLKEGDIYELDTYGEEIWKRDCVF